VIVMQDILQIYWFIDHRIN